MLVEMFWVIVEICYGLCHFLHGGSSLLALAFSEHGETPEAEEDEEEELEEPCCSKPSLV